MANIRLSDLAQQQGINAITAQLVSGSIEFYDGVQPANGQDAVTTQNLLATLTLGVPAFQAANTDGIAVANTITADSNATGGGIATWARFKTNGGDQVFDCDVGTSGTTIIVDATVINPNAVVRINTAQIQLPDGT